MTALAGEATEVVAGLGWGPPASGRQAGRRDAGGPVLGLRVAYHSACSLQHGQGIERQPWELLAAAGFTVVEVPEGHLCCGSAGTYNLLQPERAAALRDRQLPNTALTPAHLGPAAHIARLPPPARRPPPP